MASQELRAITEYLRGEPRDSELTIGQRRARLDGAPRLLPPVEGVTTELVTAAGMRAAWFSPAGAPDRPAVLYLHGGAYQIGSIASHGRLAGGLAMAAATRVLVPEYRLAPEHPHPAAVEDAVAAWRWLLDEGGDPGRLAIAGDSAGGGLAIATMVAARDAGLPLPSAAAVLSPWVDLEGLGESLRTRADLDPLLDASGVAREGAVYLGGRDPRTPLAAPMYADLHGLPPLLIHVGDHEILRDDAVRLAEKARADGVEITLEIWPEMIHVWHYFAGLVPESTRALDEVGRFLAERFGSARAA
jgi:monoterpene epsilon-lactone hydrolase